MPTFDAFGVPRPDGAPVDLDYENLFDRHGYIPYRQDMPDEAQRIVKLLGKAKVVLYKAEHRKRVSALHPDYLEWGIVEWHRQLAKLEDQLEEIGEIIKEWSGET